MNKKLAITLMALAVILSTLACSGNINGVNFGNDPIEGSGNVVSEEREVSGFSRLELAGLGKLVVEFGEEEALTVEAEDNLLPYIETEVRGQRLVIKMQEGISINPTESITYYLTVVELDSVEVSGLINAILPEITTTDFTLDISGGGDVDIAGLYAARLTVNISGLGDVTVDEGEVTDLVVDISGGGSFKAGDLESEYAEVEISGLGSATLRVSKRLEVKISGGGSVEYYGSPSVDSDISGVGDVEKLGD